MRSIGVELELPAKMVHWHPFPGPGVRILGEVTPLRLRRYGGRIISSSRSCARLAGMRRQARRLRSFAGKERWRFREWAAA
jgi:hypothetical protein